MRVFLKIRKKLCIGHFFDHFDTPLFTQCTFGNYKKFSDNILKLQKNSSKPVCVSILTSATMIYFSEKLFLCVPLAQLVVIHWLASSHLVITQCRRRRPFQNTKCPWIRWKIQIPVSIFVLKISRYLIDFFGFSVHTFHPDENVGDAKDIFKQKLSHALGCMRIKPSLFHSLVVSKKYDSIEGVLKKYLCSVIQG